MKEIKDWETVIKDENGEEKMALPLPGCVVKGKVDGNVVEVSAQDIDISNLTVIDGENQEYMLAGASQQYLDKINICIEVGENERDGEER